jgi:hypothetical protein
MTGEDILCRSLELRVGESSGRAGSPERLAVVLSTVQACQVLKPWTLEGHFPVEQNILLDAGGYAISKHDSALTEEDVYELANRDMAFVPDNLAYIDLLTEFAHTTGTELERPAFGAYGGWGSRVSPVWARNPSMSWGRYWMRLSRFLTIAASWPALLAARLPRPFFMFAQAPSAGLRSGA